MSASEALQAAQLPNWDRLYLDASSKPVYLPTISSALNPIYMGVKALFTDPDLKYTACIESS